MTDAREQFGREAIKYLHSASHSNEAALARCLECVQPRGGPVLDVATAIKNNWPLDRASLVEAARYFQELGAQA